MKDFPHTSEIYMEKNISIEYLSCILYMMMHLIYIFHDHILAVIIIDTYSLSLFSYQYSISSLGLYFTLSPHWTSIYNNETQKSMIYGRSTSQQEMHNSSVNSVVNGFLMLGQWLKSCSIRLDTRVGLRVPCGPTSQNKKNSSAIKRYIK